MLYNLEHRYMLDTNFTRWYGTNVRESKEKKKETREYRKQRKEYLGEWKKERTKKAKEKVMIDMNILQIIVLHQVLNVDIQEYVKSFKMFNDALLLKTLSLFQNLSDTLFLYSKTGI